MVQRAQMGVQAELQGVEAGVQGAKEGGAQAELQGVQTGGQGAKAGFLGHKAGSKANTRRCSVSEETFTSTEAVQVWGQV